MRAPDSDIVTTVSQSMSIVANKTRLTCRRVSVKQQTCCGMSCGVSHCTALGKYWCDACMAGLGRKTKLINFIICWATFCVTVAPIHLIVICTATGSNDGSLNSHGPRRVPSLVTRRAEVLPSRSLRVDRSDYHSYFRTEQEYFSHDLIN